MAESRRIQRQVRRALALAGVVAAFAYMPGSQASHIIEDGAGVLPHGTRLVMPIMSPERGQKLFVDKGCVACHAINGVGGHDAPNLDAHTRTGLVNPFDFAAKMWNHATGMIAAQEGALGEQIVFTGEELADITAFVHDDSAQHRFSESDLTARARKMMQHDHGATSGDKAHAKELGHIHDGPSRHHRH